MVEEGGGGGEGRSGKRGGEGGRWRWGEGTVEVGRRDGGGRLRWEEMVEKGGEGGEEGWCREFRGREEWRRD